MLFLAPGMHFKKYLVYNVNYFTFVPLIAFMETKNDNLSAQESLDLISKMISQAKGNVGRSSFYFLLWGWVIAACNFGMYAMLEFSAYPRYAPAVWMLCIPAWIISIIHGRNQEKERIVKTHLDEISKWLWISMGIAICPAWILGEKLNWMVNAVILMPVGVATFVSGIIVRFRPLLIGGIVFWIAGIVCYFVGSRDQYLVGGIATILGYLVPGYMLRNQKENHA